MNNNKKKFPQGKLALAILVASCGSLYDPAVLAQEDTIEEISVTGSRIRAVNGMVEATPVTAITVDELQDFNPGSTVAAQLDELPQFFDTQNAQRGGNAISTTAGGSYLNMRGMGQNRTLVLVDGTRMTPADAQGSVNVDMLPSALMQRIDVVTGGASAAYGADAVAGVVNFILNREFEGLTANVSTGITQELDGENYSFSIAGGSNYMDGRLHLIGSLEARQIDQVGPDHSRYDNWQDWGLVRNPNWVSATATPNEPSRIHAPYVFTSGGAPQGLLITGGDFAYQNWVFTDDGTGVRPYAFGDYMSNAGAGNTNNQSGGPEYLYYDRASPRGMSSREVAQRSFFGGFKYDVSDNFHIFGQTVLGRSESNFYDNVSNMAFSAFPLYAFKVYRENAYLPEVVGVEMDRLGLDMINMIPVGVIEGPGLTNIYDERGDRSVQQLQSYTAGFEWDIDSNWNLMGSFQSGETKISTGILNVPRLDKYFMAADAVRHPETNEIVCNISLVNPTPEQLAAVVAGVKFPSPIDPLGIDVDSPLGPLDPQECVPFNIFGIGNANQEARDWILEKEKKQMRWLNQDFAELLLTGVIHEGWGAGPLSIATGLTWRDEDFRQINRPSYGERGLLNVPALGIRAISDGFAGAGNRSLHPFSSIGVGDGARDVWEWYAELNVPLWEWDGGQRIGSTMAYRSSDYSGSGRQESWKLGLDMQIIESLRWRATKSQDIREPNFAEIFLTGTGGGQVQDPFRGDETAGGITVLATSNPALGAEMGDTITTGLVWQPVFAEWIEGLQVAVDWYEINLEGAVAPYGAQRIVDDCFATGAASACDLIQRVPNVDDDGFGYTPISRILNQNVNADFAQTRGVDFEVIYNTDVDFFSNEAETLSLRALFGYLAENSTTTLAGTTQDQAQSRTRPEWSGILRAAYSLGPWSFSLQGQYFDSVQNSVTWVQGVDIDDNWIASNTVFNFGAAYRGELESGTQWRVGLNIANIFDRDPSIAAGTAGQALLPAHDQLGRRYQLTLNLDF